MRERMPEDQSPRAVGKRVRRAASRGPVPEDPDERQAAHEMALDHLREFDRQRYWAPALFVALAVVWAGVALDRARVGVGAGPPAAGGRGGTPLAARPDARAGGAARSRGPPPD